MYLYKFKFSSKIFTDFPLRFSGAFKTLKIEVVNFSQMLMLERRPNPFLKDHLSASPSEDLGNVSKDV